MIRICWMEQIAVLPDDGVEQISGVTPVDFLQGDVTYTIDYNFMGNSNPKLTQQALVTVSVSH